jgi:DNA-binding ferritin-like protein (Dps family)
MTYFVINPELYERERIFLEFIKKFPDVHHNALLKMIVPKYMAKTTFEKTRDYLLEREAISVQKKGNMKIYVLTLNYELKSQQHIERLTNTAFHNLKNHIKKLETDYRHKDVNEKIAIANSLLKNILQTDTGFTILDSVKNPRKTLYHDEHLTIQQLIHEVFKIIYLDKDYDTIYPTIMSHIWSIMPTDYQDSS